MAASSPFDSVVLAGGGCRCFWQIGFWATVADEIGLKPRQISGVSAGSAMALALITQQGPETLEIFKAEAAANARNVYPKKLLASGQSAFPHYDMYRRALLEVLHDEAMQRVAAGPELRILVAHPPERLGPRSAVLVGFLCYSVEKKLKRPVHARWARALGFRGETVRAQDCESAEALADLVLASSCTPPFTPVQYRSGQAVLDGGLVDGAPAEILDAPSGRTLVLLTRRYPGGLPGAHQRTYVQPSQPTPVAKWDYTSPDKLQATYDLGQRDGERFLERWTAEPAAWRMSA